MKKKRILSGLALVAGMASLAPLAQAEEVIVEPVEGTESIVEPSLEEKIATLEPQVEAAKEVADQEGQAVKIQEGLVKTATTAQAQAQASRDSLANQLSKVEAVTPQQVEEARVASEEASSDLSDASDALEVARGSVTSASEAVTAQEGVVANAQAEVDRTASAVADAEKKVESLSGEVSTSELEGEVSTLEEAVSKDTENLTVAKEALSAAQLAETNKAEAISLQEGVVLAKEADVDTTAKALVEATTAKTTTTNSLSEASVALETAKAGTTVTETVQVGEKVETVDAKTTLKDGVFASAWYESNGVLTNDAYISAIKALAEGKGSTDAVLSAVKEGVFGMTSNSADDLNNVTAPSRAGFGAWIENYEGSMSSTDSTTLVSPHDLTVAQRTDLSNFMVALINDLRSRVGTAPLVVTKDSVAHTKTVVDTVFNNANPQYKDMTLEQLTANGFWEYHGVDGRTDRVATFNEIIKEVSKLVNSDSKIFGWLPGNRQNLNRLGFSGDMVTMAELKYGVVATLGNMLYGSNGHGGLGEEFGGIDGQRGENYEAALYLLGLKGDYSSAGVDFEFTATESGAMSKAPVAYITFTKAGDSALSNPYQTSTGGTVTRTPIFEERTTTKVDPKAVADAQAKFDKAQQAKIDADNAFEVADANYVSAQSAYAEAQKQLSDLKSGSVDLGALNQAVLDAETQLSKDEASLQSARETLAIAKSNQVDRSVALATAKSELSSAKEAHTSASGVLSTEVETLTTLKNALGVAELALARAISAQATASTIADSASTRYAELSDALANRNRLVEELTTKLVEAEQALEDAKKHLVNETSKLEPLKTSYQKAQAEYDRLLALLQGLKAQLPKPIIFPEDKEQATDKSDKVIKNQVQQAYNRTLTKQVSQQLTAKAGAYSSAYQANLPETGDANSSLILALGLSLLGFGLGAEIKRKRVR